jgi:hypothetical protein
VRARTLSVPARTEWLPLLANAALPAYTAFRYAQFALSPAQFDEAYGRALTTLFLAQLPLCLLGAVFASVGYLPGPGWRRVLAYLGVLAVIGVIGGFARIQLDSDYALIIAYAIALQVVLLMFVGEQPALALARIDAMAQDAANLVVLSMWGGVIAIIGALLLQDLARGRGEWQDLQFAMSDIAWIGAIYFALRAWSAAYPFTPAFMRRRKGYFQRDWIDKVTSLGRTPAGNTGD